MKEKARMTVMINNKFLAIFIFSFIIFFSNCATIFEGKKINKGVYITSNIEGATVYNSDGRNEFGKTPLLINEQKKKKDLNLLIEKENYLTAQRKIEVIQANQGYLFLDAMLLCIPCIVDVTTGALEKYEFDSIMIPLKRIIEKDGKPVAINIDNVVWKVKEGQTIGKEMKTDIYFKKNSIDSRQYTENICTEMEGTRYESQRCGENKKKSSYGINYSNITLIPIIKEIYLKEIKHRSQYAYASQISIDWIFIQNEKDTIAIFDDKVSLIVNSSEKRKVINALINLSMYNLLNDDITFEKVSTTKSKNLQNEPKTLLTNIDKIKAPVLSNGLTPVIKQLVKSVVTIAHKEGHGSGFIISSDGYIITNYHVIENNQNLVVQLNEKLSLKAEVVKINPEYDLALLKIDAKELIALALGNSEKIEIGEEVIAIGTPVELSYGQTVSKGIISGKRKLEEHIYIQTDASVNAGNSGGPLINQNAEVIGIVSRKRYDKEGIAFAIPINEAIEKLNIIQNEK